MFTSRRSVLGLLSAAIASLPLAARAYGSPLEAPTAVLGCQLHDEVSLSLLRTYARSLALQDADARRKAQMMFHKAQLARDGGGTMGHKLGSRHKVFLEAHEREKLSTR